MTTRAKMVLIVSIAICGAALGATAQAGASTFCVPGFHAACPNNGTNVAQADLETAMKANSSDGIPDKVIIDGVTVTNPGTFETTGFDDLEIIGAGPDKTHLTTSATGDVWVVNLDFGSSREVTMRDLSIVVPETAGLNTSAVASDGDTFENVDIISHNPNAQGVSPAEGGTTFRDGALIPAGIGSFDIGFWVNPGGDHSGGLRIERTSIIGARRGVSVDPPNTPLYMRGVQVLNPSELALTVGSSNDVTVENSVLQNGTSSPIFLFSNEPERMNVDLTNVTIDSSSGDSTQPAINGTVQAVSGNGSIDIEVDSSIIRTFDKTWQLTAPGGNVGIGDAFIALRHSNFLPAGTNAGDGTTFIDPSNTQGDPRFRGPGDFRLLADSPAIDAGDPDAALTTDLLGQIRPVDGNDDGKSVIDQGAYEYLPPAKPKPVCETNPALCPDQPGQDTTPPAVTSIKFLPPTKKKGGYLKLTLSEAATVKATMKPTPVGKGRNKRKTVKITKKGRAGVNKFSIKKGSMKPGRYRLTLVATDATGNRSGTLSGKLRVKRRPS